MMGIPGPENLRAESPYLVRKTSANACDLLGDCDTFVRPDATLYDSAFPQFSIIGSEIIQS